MESSPELATWRAQVEADLAGASFEKTLVHQTVEGLKIAPLYTRAPALPRVLGDGAPFRICMRHDAATTKAALAEDLANGVDALWLPRAALGALPDRLPPHLLLVVDEDDTTCRLGGGNSSEERAALVSTLALHVAGADALDEVAFALASVVASLGSTATSLVVRVAAGRDTFVELCKIRALRLTVRKVLAAAGATTPFKIHAVASPRTIAARDPWVNILRVTTELFAAVLGGADLVTPLAFDEALASPSPLGRRLARNTGHVLREESALGRVVDPGAGSYFLDTLTDAIAREAWTRFRAVEREGGISKSTSLHERVAATRSARRGQIAKRKLPILGVSEFAHPTEKLPSRPRTDEASSLRDDAAFEGLRARADALPPERSTVLLATLGPTAESRARVGFAASFFTTAGLSVRELGESEAPTSGSVACLCSSDERYASEGVSRARALKAAGCRRVLVAGRPGPTEKELRAAGVDDFIYVSGDVVAALGAVLDSISEARS